MPAYQPVNRVFWRFLIQAVLPLCLIGTSACTDKTASATAEGALAQSQLDAGQIRLARETIAGAIRDRDDIPEIHILRGKIELAAGSPATAFAAFNNALSLDASNAEALLGVAEIGLQLGYLRDTEDATNRILTLAPGQPNALLIKGLLNFNKRRYDEALANAEAILATSPADEGALILKTRTLALLGRDEEALAVTAAASQRRGMTRGLAATLLEIDRRRDDGRAMIQQLETLRKLQPGDLSLALDEANTLYKLGDGNRARAVLQGLLLNPKVDETTAAAATRLWKEFETAPLDAGVLAQIAAKAGLPARMALARYWLDLKDPDRAEAVLRGAPAQNDVAALQARISAARGRIDESMTTAEAILRKDATHCDALLAKAEAALARQRTSAAATASQTATGNCPQLVPAYLVLARARELAGSKEGADVALRDAFNRNDQDPDLTRAYAAWLERHGETRRAVALARRLTNNAPALVSGWQLYRDLCGRLAAGKCTPEAEAGLASARQRFEIDPRTGERPPLGLFGRLPRP